MELNEFNALIKLIVFKTGLKESDIAKKMKRNITFLSQVRNTAKEEGLPVPEKTVDLIKTHFSKYLESKDSLEPTPQMERTMIAGIAARQIVHGRYIAEIYAKSSGMSVTKVLSEMENLELEKVEHLLRKSG